MKKIFALLMICSLVLMTGCGGQQGGDNKPAEKGAIKLGTIKHLNVTETLLDNYFEKAASRMNQTAGMYAPKHVFFDNMVSMLAALDSKQIDAISTYESVAAYITAQNPDMQFEISDPAVTDIFCFAMRADETALQKEFNSVIFTISKSGKLAQLVKNYINDFNHADEPNAVELPTFYGKPTIKIGVTGDLPLLDYIRADGKPAGFNTAVLAEISRIIEKNFVLVQIDSGARAAALTSGQIDVIFWAVAPQTASAIPYDFDKPENVIFTKSYFADDVAHVRMKNEAT